MCHSPSVPLGMCYTNVQTSCLCGKHIPTYIVMAGHCIVIACIIPERGVVVVAAINEGLTKTQYFLVLGHRPLSFVFPMHP